MKIFEVTKPINEVGAPVYLKGQYKTQPSQKDYDAGVVPVTALPLANTDASELEYNGINLKGKLFALGTYNNVKDILKGIERKDISAFYFADGSGSIVRLNDKPISQQVMKALKVSSQDNRTVVQKAKDKAADFFDPNAIDRDGYLALQRKNAAQDKLSVGLTRAGAKLDKGLNYLGNKIMGKGKTGVPSDFQKYGNWRADPQNQSTNFKVGDKVSWEAKGNNKGIKQGQKVTSTIYGLEGQVYTDKAGNEQVVKDGNALFKTASQGGLIFQKPLKDLVKAQ